MAEAERQDVLRRKARTGREEHQARVMSPARALRLSLARAADDLFDLALSVSSIHSSEGGQEATVQCFAEDRLLMVLDGPEGRIGAASVDLEIVTGLIEMQTMGHVLNRKAEDRAPTPTDAALVAPLIDRMLQGFAANLEGEAAVRWAEGYRFGAMIEERRMLSLIFEAPDFHLFRVQCELGSGTRVGEILLALPQPAAAESEDFPDGMGEAARHGAPTMEQGALMAAQAPLVAVLHRLKMPLDRIAGLKPGDVLPIPREALTETRLEADKGHGMGRCRLGQINGMRAVRLVGAIRMMPEAEASIGGAGDGGPDVGARLPALGERAGLPDPAEGPELPSPEEAKNLAPGIDGFSDQSDLPGQDVSRDLPDLSDLPELGDFSDLPELAFGD